MRLSPAMLAPRTSSMTRVLRAMLCVTLGGVSACGARTGLLVAPTDARGDARDAISDDVPEDAASLDADGATDAPEAGDDTAVDAPDASDASDASDVSDAPDDGLVRECNNDNDCDDGLFCTGVERCVAARCVRAEPVQCDDRDPCTEDRCDEASRACALTPLTVDQDRDGHRGLREGLPLSCGDDCDDEDPAVFPGAAEVCNGRDDNCNRAIDEGTTLTPTSIDVAVSELSMNPAGPGGLVWASDRWAATYYGYESGKARVYWSSRRRDGGPARMPAVRRVSTADEADAFGAALAWSGSAVGALWADRRGGDFEMYFNLFTPDGDKLGPDQRLSFADGFSINGSLAFNGLDFFAAWQDERFSFAGTSNFEVLGQRIDNEGRQLEENQRLTDAPRDSESPVVAANPNDGSFGFVWIDGRDGRPSDPTSRGVYFGTYDSALRPRVSQRRISPAGQVVFSPVITWVRDRWIVAWYDDADSSPDHEVWGAAFSPAGAALVAPRRLTIDPGFSRYPSLVSLGESVLLVWADDRAGGGYDVYAQRFSPELAADAMPMRVTNAPRDSVYPIAAASPSGDVGVLFRDQRAGRWEVRFSVLRCAAPR